MQCIFEVARVLRLSQNLLMSKYHKTISSFGDRSFIIKKVNAVTFNFLRHAVISICMI